MASSVKPLLFGYMTIRLDASEDAVENNRRIIEAFARREGFDLGTIFIEQDLNRPMSALVALIEAAQRQDPQAVVVPTPDDLGRMPRVRRMVRDVLEIEAGVRVLIVQPVGSLEEVVDLARDRTTTASVEDEGDEQWPARVAGASAAFVVLSSRRPPEPPSRSISGRWT